MFAFSNSVSLYLYGFCNITSDVLVMLNSFSQTQMFYLSIHT